jgi:hypothetical protein
LRLQIVTQQHSAGLPRREQRARAYTYLYIPIGNVALAVIALCPLLVVAIPAMVDYPNHLARMYILTDIARTARNPFYEVRWGLYPNLAMDIIVPVLANYTGVATATKTFCFLSLALITSGSMIIELLVKKKIELSAVIASTFLYSLPVAFGFLNFAFGLGIALWGIAGWIGLKNKVWYLRMTVHCIVVATLLVSHLFALGLYGTILALYESHQLIYSKTFFRSAASILVTLCFPIAIALIATWALGGKVGGARTEWHYLLKIPWMFTAMNGYNVIFSAVATAILVFAFLILYKQRLLTISSEGRLLAGGLLMLFLIMPFRLFDTSFVDVRVIVAAVLILPAFVSLTIPNLHLKCGILAGISCIALANVIFVYIFWRSYDREYQSLISSFGQLNKGSFVLVGETGSGEDPPVDLDLYPMYHAPTLAVHYAGALVPTLYTYAGKQPISVRPDLKRLVAPQGGPVPITVLKYTAACGALPDTVPQYVQNWPRDFDYLYIVGPRVANPLPGLLEEMSAGQRFVLYRIKKYPGQDNACPIAPKNR